ncbi:MAG: hypothetical protein Q9160_003782 [Pyrenula sp. 1 TL-2023]
MLTLHLLRTLFLMTVPSILALALPSPPDANTNTHSVCNCQNMSGADGPKSTFGVNQCTLFVNQAQRRGFCVLDSNHEIFYECPVAAGANSPNCNACKQSADGANDDNQDCPQPNTPDSIDD